MKLAIGADHAAFELKENVRALLLESGQGVIDVGTHDATPADYPDFTEAVCAMLYALCDILLNKRGESLWPYPRWPVNLLRLSY